MFQRLVDSIRTRKLGTNPIGTTWLVNWKEFYELYQLRHCTESSKMFWITWRKIRDGVVYGRKTITSFDNFILEIHACGKTISQRFVWLVCRQDETSQKVSDTGLPVSFDGENGFFKEKKVLNCKKRFFLPQGARYLTLALQMTLSKSSMGICRTT